MFWTLQKSYVLGRQMKENDSRHPLIGLNFNFTILPHFNTQSFVV